MGKVARLLKFVLEIILVLWFFVALKKMSKYRWIYFFCLWFFVLVFSLFPAAMIHVLFAGENSLGSVLHLPWTFYVLYVPTVLLFFRISDMIVNSILTELNEVEKTYNKWKDLIIGFLLILMLFYFVTGGISEMRKRDELWRKSVNGERLNFKN